MSIRSFFTTASDVAEAPGKKIAPDRPLRVCVIAYAFCESDSRILRYNEALAARGDTVDAIALREPGQPRVVHDSGISRIAVQTRTVNERSQFSYLFRILLFFWRAMLLVSWRQLRYRYDVIHIHSVPEFLVFTAWLPKLMGTKLILDIHDLLPEFYISKFEAGQTSLIFKFLLAVERLSVAFVDHVITANDLWHEKLVGRCVPPEKATALLNYPDRLVFHPRGRDRTDNRFLIIYPGSLNWHQGLDIAIEAFAKVKREAPHAEFHIYGTGPALPALKDLVKRLGLQDSVLFRGMLPLREIARVMENADLSVVPKRTNSFGNEAFSTKILEFMALGVPVIVSDTRIDRHYFTDATVRFFRGNNVDELATCILDLITNRAARESLIANGFDFVHANSWDVKKTLYFDIMDSLVEQPAATSISSGRPVF